MEFFFYGFESTINGIALTYFGQIVEMPQATAEAAIRAFPKAMLLPKVLADEVKFTAADLATYRTAASHASAPPEFRAKKETLIAMAEGYTAGLEPEPSDGSEHAEHEGQS